MPNSNVLKALFRICLLFVFSGSMGQSHQWIPVQTGTTMHLQSLSTLGNDLLVATGDSGTLLLLSSAFPDWQKIQLPTNSRIVSAERIRFLSNQWKNILMTETGEVFRLTDSTGNCQSDTLPAMPGGNAIIHKLLHLNIANINEIRYGILYNNGRMMGYKFPFATPRFDVSFSTGKPISDLYAYNTWNILAVGDSGKIWRTAGLNDPFQRVNQNLTNHRLHRIFGRRDQKIWIAGDSGTLLYSGNGGQSWSALPVPDQEDNLGGCKTDSAIWLCGTGGRILMSTDQGITWQIEITQTTEDLNDVLLFQNQLYCVGQRGTLLKRSTINQVTTPFKEPDWQVFQEDERVVVTNPHEKNNEWRVFTATGQTICHRKETRLARIEFRLPEAGMYIIHRIENGKTTSRKKIILLPH